MAVFGIASAAGNRVKAYIAPGEFVSLYGSQLGPSPGAGAILDSQGRIVEPAVEKMVRQAASNLMAYIEKHLCPAVTLERLLREGAAATPDVVTI